MEFPPLLELKHRRQAEISQFSVEPLGEHVSEKTGDVQNASPLTANLSSRCPDSFSPSLAETILPRLHAKPSQPLGCCGAGFPCGTLPKNDRAKTEKTGTSSCPTSTFKGRFKKAQLCTAAAAQNPELTCVKHSCSLCWHESQQLCYRAASFLASRAGLRVSENQRASVQKEATCDRRDALSLLQHQCFPLRGPAPFQRCDSSCQAPRSCGRNLALPIPLTYGEIEKSVTKLNSADT